MPKRCPECNNRMYNRTKICEICGFEVIPIKKKKREVEIPIFPEPNSPDWYKNVMERHRINDTLEKEMKPIKIPIHAKIIKSEPISTSTYVKTLKIIPKKKTWNKVIAGIIIFMVVIGSIGIGIYSEQHKFDSKIIIIKDKEMDSSRSFSFEVRDYIDSLEYIWNISIFFEYNRSFRIVGNKYIGGNISAYHNYYEKVSDWSPSYRYIPFPEQFNHTYTTKYDYSERIIFRLYYGPIVYQYLNITIYATCLNYTYNDLKYNQLILEGK